MANYSEASSVGDERQNPRKGKMHVVEGINPLTKSAAEEPPEPSLELHIRGGADGFAIGSPPGAYRQDRLKRGTGGKGRGRYVSRRLRMKRTLPRK